MSEQTVSQEIIEIIDLGLMSYGQALAEQLKIHASVVAGGKPAILMVEHPPVLTLGKNSSLDYLLETKDAFEKAGIEIFATERGGEVTAHEPGQIVVYPILPILRLGLNARSYVHCLEQAVINVLAFYGVIADRDSEHPGVWIRHEKICAIGVRIKSRVSMHGLALNVSNSLDLFRRIVPCGIRGRGVTTLTHQTNVPVTHDAVKRQLVDELNSLLL